MTIDWNPREILDAFALPAPADLFSRLVRHVASHCRNEARTAGACRII